MNFWTTVIGIGALAASIIGFFAVCAALIHFEVLPL
jgi:hypothetical protein